LYLEFGYFSSEANSIASTIGPTCAFESKIYKNVGQVLAVSACFERNRKYFPIADFCFQLPSLLVDSSAQLKTQHPKIKTNIAIAFGRNPANILPILT